jgi:hypothetical protein
VKTPHVYDKAKYHHETIQQYGLSEDHASNHTVVFFRWLIDRRLMSVFFETEAAEILAKFRAGQTTIHQVYGWWDHCLIDDMLSEDGNAFAKHYFDFGSGRYIQDYIGKLKGSRPSEFHIDYTDANYSMMKSVIDRRYSQWKKPTSWWWPFKSTQREN